MRRHHKGLIPGLIVIGVGTLLLLRNLDLIYFDDLWRFWPFILIIMGLVKLTEVARSH